MEYMRKPSMGRPSGDRMLPSGKEDTCCSLWPPHTCMHMCDQNIQALNITVREKSWLTNSVKGNKAKATEENYVL